MQAHAPARALALVERLAHERVGVGEAVELAGLADQARRGRLLERGQDVVVLEQGLEQSQVELAADDARHAQDLVGVVGELLQPARDHLLDALGHRDPAQRALLELRQAAQRLLDEERVALGLLGQAPHELRGDVVARDQRARLLRRQPAQIDALEERLPAQPAEQLALDAARGAEHEQAHRRRVLEQVAEQQQRRCVGPVQVVEQQHDRALAGREREHPRHALEQPVAAQLRLLGQRLPRLRRRACAGRGRSARARSARAPARRAARAARGGRRSDRARR